MDGIVIINKEKDYTSHDVVAVVKKTLKEKVGHTGTLDPEATGVLPLLIGKATRISKYLIEHDKTYCAILALGIKTDTADFTGNIIQKQDIQMPNSKQIEQVLFSMLGENKQTPPMFSAIKVKGKKLYEYARQGEMVEIPSRLITIYEIELENIDENKKEITFKVHCGKGTYIRTLCEQIAEKLGTIGCMKELQRLRVGSFKIEDSITINELKQEKNISSKIITIEGLFSKKQEIILDDKKMEQFLNGVKLEYALEDDIYRIYNINNQFVGIGVVKSGILKRDVVLIN